MREVMSHPRGYLTALDRTLLLYSGSVASQVESGTFVRASVLARSDALISLRPEGCLPLDVEFSQRTGHSLMARCFLIEWVSPLPEHA